MKSHMPALNSHIWHAQIRLVIAHPKTSLRVQRPTTSPAAPGTPMMPSNSHSGEFNIQHSLFTRLLITTRMRSMRARDASASWAPGKFFFPSFFTFTISSLLFRLHFMYRYMIDRQHTGSHATIHEDGTRRAAGLETSNGWAVGMSHVFFFLFILY